jgi:arylsulfatase
VEDKDYNPPFTFTGKLKKLTIKLGPSGLSAAQQEEAEDKAAAMQDAPRQD